MNPDVYHPSSHAISHDLIDPDALYIIEHLRARGHLAYLVGGSVRDLLIKKRPKDFDISTSARPEEIKKVFGKRCLLIGRRFRLAHVRAGKKIFEVSTFRSGSTDSDDLIVNDNVWGSEEEDVLRRDFTINGLYYDPTEHTVLDYVGGWDDVQKNVLRTIGPAYSRFNQDPVRMIRLLKFQSRLNFSVDPEALQALERCKHSITLSAPARILEEVMRMLESGASKPFFELMAKHEFIEMLFPWLQHFLEGTRGEITYSYLDHADKINQNRRYYPLDRGVLLCCLLYPILESEIDKQFIQKGHSPHLGQLTELTFSLIKAIITSSFSHFPKKLSSSAATILLNQFKLTPYARRSYPPNKMLSNKEIKYSIYFLRIRSLVNPQLNESYEHWNSLLERKKLAHHEH